MREILFRGKQLDNGEWVKGYYAVIENPLSKDGKPEKHLICNGTNVFNYEVIPDTVGQYTGLTDKNGKKIFEGDIVKHSIGTFIVKFSNGIFLSSLTEDNYLTFLCSIHNQSEVIGNIHDNPELLKGAKDDA